MTCRTEKIITEKKGVNAFKTLVEEQGGIFRENFGCDDIGHDGNVEGIEIKVQIKSGESYFNGNNVFIKGDKKHFEYWERHILPTIGIVYNPKNKILYWTNISEYLEQ